ncbi:EPIDERMAL PATTERNING FACTOR-like protein 2 [Panicum virgatum]|uniref:Epidermal patterning factor-like protein n=1 Tax=Panicum virgatum TaxID=38727 RepID=A0A8T0VIF0_PANVG|nr:EPIDERMAL PATTERNING FACTOR-like protein 2 [Panicum virgatum]XP_039798021.1 EPIDERMAL PATTERNING FACTOR-like protein 2 [Panicum virgatum]KAG2631509.1 hypothetical protein PVAP13_2NG030300 [Panicum virgatum]
MVHSLHCSIVHTLPRPLFFSILLILTSSMEVAHSDARSLLEVGVGKAQDEDAAAIRGEMRGWRALIGSRPPRCERVCMSYGHCEAVQVPIVPQDRRQKRAAAASTGAADEEERVVAAAAAAMRAAMFTYRVDDITNYKPLSWKCRCGGTILDP